MGQKQSSDSGTSQNEGQTKADDYYDRLGVERQATDEEIKKAYRRKALELHPDRNYGNVEQATRLFADIQSAYEVLSDPQERAWYDSHREVFLGSQPGQPANHDFFYNTQMTTAADVIKLMMKHSGQSDYSNSATGFYGALRAYFSQLAKEEEIACKWENMDPVEYPDFGQKDDDYEEVVRPFYAAWNGFSTTKSYSWKTYYRPAEAPDRRIRRLMEKENKSLREDAIREFNDAVRSLIAFVRKRDPRYQGNQKSEEERQKILRDAAATQSARSRAARQAKLDEIDRLTVPEWAKSTITDDHEGDFSSDDDLERQEIECVVCNKTFKSEAQYEAHEKSKKHVKLLKRLQREMREEDHQIGDPDDAVVAPTVNPAALGLDEEDAGAENGEAHVGDNSSGQQGPNTTGLDEEDAGAENGEAHVRDNSNGQQGPSTTGLDKSATSVKEDNDSDGESGSSTEKSGHEGDGFSRRSIVDDRLAEAQAEELADQLYATAVEDTGLGSDTGSSCLPKVGKAKQKRAKKAAQTKARATENSRPDDVRCAVCQAEFASKTKLFNHIEERGHAAPVLKSAGAQDGNGNGKTRKDKKK